MDRRYHLNQKGQSTVEYLLLIIVVLSLAMVFFKSDSFQNFFGPESNFFKAMKDGLEVSYRHAYIFPIEEDSDDYAGIHKSFSENGTQSRFFVDTKAYGQ